MNTFTCFLVVKQEPLVKYAMVNINHCIMLVMVNINHCIMHAPAKSAWHYNWFEEMYLTGSWWIALPG